MLHMFMIFATDTSGGGYRIADVLGKHMGGASGKDEDEHGNDDDAGMSTGQGTGSGSSSGAGGAYIIGSIFEQT